MNRSLAWGVAALLTASAASAQDTHKPPSQEHKAPAADSPKPPAADTHKAPSHDRDKPAAEPHGTPAGPARTKHGIVLRREPKAATAPKAEAGESAKTGESAKSHSPVKGGHETAPAAHPRAGKTEPVEVTPGAAASPERVAGAIAEAIRQAEAKRASSPPRPRAPRPSAAHVPPRRYTLQWPNERFEVEWPQPESRVRLAWTAEME